MANANKINTDVLNELIIGRVEPQIYAFTTETVPNYLKVGDTYRPLEVRLNEWRKHFPKLVKQFGEVAKVDDDTFFRDYAVHFFLENELKKSRLVKGSIKNIPHYSNEFFQNATEEDLKAAIKDIKKSHKNNDPKYQYYRFDESRIKIETHFDRIESYKPRPNQQETIENFKKAIEKGRDNLLMYAVMRFGKSFTSMCCAVEMGAKLVVVVSAKADVKEEWKRTTESHVKFDGFCFLDNDSLLQSDNIINEKLKENKKIVLFLTLQDLSGKEFISGNIIKTKFKKVFNKLFDLLIIDETHFGARASEYGKVLKEENLSKKEIKNELKLNDDDIEKLQNTTKKFLKAKVRIHLSGTPYRILMNGEFQNDDIIAFYQFSDIAEDQEKWNLRIRNINDHRETLGKLDIPEWKNPYYGFPQMIRFAFNPNESSRKKMEEIKKHGVTYAFSELFRPQSIIQDKAKNLHKKFKYEKEILDLLKVIDGTEKDENLLSFLDYDKIKEGQMCRHIVCVLPYRASCDALESLISKNEFKHLSNYEIINISGVESEKVYKDTESVKSKIRKSESENKRTITLTVNRMLTGSTVHEWDTMLYFKDTASPQEYDQAIFRLQNQYIRVHKEPNGDVVKFNMKPQTLLVDFDPNRMFRMQENKSLIYNINTEKGGNTKLEERIQIELEISPIVVLNKNIIQQVQPSNILDAVREYSSSRSVLDEATSIAVDLSLLNIEKIKAEIEKQGKIGSRQGVEVKGFKGEGDEFELEVDTGDGESGASNRGASKPTSGSDESEIDYRGKFAMYYARILFFAFLTESKVKSLQEIIESAKKNKNNERIFSNLSLDIKILLLLQRHINKLVLIELDRKIYNINSLSNDTSLPPILRASNAMKKFSRLSDSEVVTPETVTEKIINGLPSKAIGKSTFLLDIASKQGEFVYALYKATYKKYGKAIANNFYSIPTSKIAYEFTRKVYTLLELDINRIEKNYSSYDLISENKIVKNGIIKINNKKMKFNVIVGNPPYQDKGGSGGNNDAPIFQHFSRLATALSTNYVSLIIPSRWFAAGRENLLGDFRKEMLNNGLIEKLQVFSNSSSLFPAVEIKGGVCIYLENKNHKSNLCSFELIQDGAIQKSTVQLNAFDILIREPMLASIVTKVEKIRKSLHLKTVDTIISSDTPFGIPSNPKESKKTPFKVYSNLSKEHDVLLFHIEKLVRKVEYAKRSDIKKNVDAIDKYKVFITGSGGSGNDSKVMGYPEFGPKKSVCSQSYLYSAFDTKKEAENFIKYIKTKFFRSLVSAVKITQSAPSKTYKFVPLEDTSSKSDINWDRTIEEIDIQVFKKYKLTKDEISFIDKKISYM
jgi:hypothetical protein